MGENVSSLSVPPGLAIGRAGRVVGGLRRVCGFKRANPFNPFI